MKKTSLQRLLPAGKKRGQWTLLHVLWRMQLIRVDEQAEPSEGTSVRAAAIHAFANPMTYFANLKTNFLQILMENE